MATSHTRPTVHDIAREANVSLATVDRVLNERSGVREATVEKVRAAIARLGYVRDTAAANLARQRSYRFAFVLPDGPSLFADAIRKALRAATVTRVTERITLSLIAVPAHDPHLIVRKLQALDPTLIDGVALMVPETPQVRDAVTRMKRAGMVVIAMASDLPNSERDFFVGIDSLAAGRTAAQILGKFARGPGQILVVTNSMRSRDSLERRLGFDQVMQAHFPHLAVLPSLESFDDPGRMENLVLDALLSRPALVGLYSMGSGNLAVLRALRRSARRMDLAVIMHELTDPLRAALLADDIDAVIAQNVGHLVRSALRVMCSLSDQLAILEGQERLRIEIILRENLPPQS
ncbi:MAG: LacI family DNA-binding transcriptional regulator [Roseinatronobacter sp.]